MSSPLLDGAGYVRHPKKLGTKKEVLAALFADLGPKLGTQYEVESKEARQQRYCDDLISLDHSRVNESASRSPQYEITGPHLPHDYIDDRMKVRFGRFGARIND